MNSLNISWYFWRLFETSKKWNVLHELFVSNGGKKKIREHPKSEMESFTSLKWKNLQRNFPKIDKCKSLKHYQGSQNHCKYF